MISPRSRYRTATLTKVETPAGARVVIAPIVPETYQISYTYHLVLAGDRIDRLAARHYGDATLWWAIARANPEIMDWRTLHPGTILRIPNG